MREFPRTLKHVTLWLLLGTAVFLAVQAWQAQQRKSRFSVQGGVIAMRAGLYSNCIRFVPPLVITEAEVDEAVAIFGRVLRG